VGLESSLEKLKAVGPRAAMVAVVGVAVPVAMGYAVLRIFDHDASLLTSLFIGATLAATSVGITARVLRDLGRENSLEARVVLGAAVVDDVLGLLLLSFLVAGARGVGSVRDTAMLGVQATAFLAVSVMVLPSLLLCLPLMGWAADRVGLAPIVGAFAAGLAISSARKSGPASDAGAAAPWDETSHDPIPLRASLRGLAAVLAPLFFVEMGRRVDLRAAMSGGAPRLLLALIAVAVLGKIVAGVAAPKGTRLAVGLGMIPRGEVGLIFAGLGRSLGLVDAATTSTLVLVVLATTLIGPPALRWRLKA